MANEVKIRVGVVDNATAKLKNIEGSVGNMANNTKSRMETATTASMAFATGLGALVAAGGVAAGIGLNIAGSYQQTQIAFETMIGSAEGAQKLLADMADFAKKTPFELSQLEQATKSMMAYGISAETVLDELEVLGNIAAGVGMDKLPQLTLAYGQVRAATKLTGAELRQFTEAGVPLLEELSKVTGMTTKEMAGNIGDLDISFEQVQEALANMTGEGGRFFDLMERQSTTFFGMISNLKDSFVLLMREAFMPLLHAIEPWLARLVAFVAEITPQVGAALANIGTWMSEHRAILLLVAGGVAGALIPAFMALAGLILGTVIPAVVASIVALAPFVLLGAAIAGAAYLMYNAWNTNFMGIRDITRTVLDWMQAKWNEWAPIVIKAVENVWIFTRTTFEVMWEFLSPWINGFVEMFSGAWNNIVGIAKGMGEILLGAFLFVFNLIAGTIKGILQLIGGDFSGAWKTWSDTVENMGNALVLIVKGIFDVMYNTIVGILEGVLNYFKGWFETIGGWFSSLFGNISETERRASDVKGRTSGGSGLSVSGPNPKAPARRAFGGFAGYADGGIVWGAGGVDNVPIWASAGELILTVAQQNAIAANMMRGRGGGDTYIIVEGNTFFADDRRLMERIADGILEYVEPHLSHNAYA